MAVTQADASWFANHPTRQHRVRFATPMEIEIESGGKEPVPSGFRVFCAVRQIKPGLRLRAFMLGAAMNDPDAGEEKARALFRIAAAVCERPTLH